ncbi:uncharacterized protein LOC143854550 [Tasmannia lanceolata]|uniref:uncharacterized protein LOC143854550 n=1 Tax=Tasmannia lanceolata TaxID=3420 RepID=UPI00406385E5
MARKLLKNSATKPLSDADSISKRLRSSSNVSIETSSNDSVKILSSRVSSDSIGKQIESSDIVAEELKIDSDTNLCNGDSADLRNNQPKICEESKIDLVKDLCDEVPIEARAKRFKSSHAAAEESESNSKINGDKSYVFAIRSVEESNDDSVEPLADGVFRVSSIKQLKSSEIGESDELENDLVKPSSKEGSALEMTDMVDDSEGVRECGRVESVSPKREIPKTPLRRFTRSVLKVKPEISEISTTMIGSEEVLVSNACENGAIVKEDGKGTDVAKELKSDSDKSLCNGDSSDLKNNPLMSSEVLCNGVPTDLTSSAANVAIDIAVEVSKKDSAKALCNGVPIESRAKRLKSSHAELKSNSKINRVKSSEIVVGAAEESNNDSVEPPPDGFFRVSNIDELENDSVKSSIKEGSALETPIMVDDTEGVRECGRVASVLPKREIPKTPLRRFTRSVLKVNPEPSEISTRASGVSVGPEEISLNKGCEKGAVVKEDAKGTDVASPLSPRKKLELKMSKKIVLNNFPNNVKELLATGLLEGMPVNYILPGEKDGLKGTVKDGRILCLCTSCKGCEVVTVLNFELHAGGSNKHAPECFYLENGNTILDVLDACIKAPLDMLEVTIQSAIGSLPGKKASICQSCKGPFHSSPVGTPKLLCNACSDSKQSQATPACGNSASSSKPVLIEASSNNSSKHFLQQKKNGHPKITKKDLGLHKLALMEDGLPDGTEVAYFVRGKKLLKGYKKGIGIFCNCCKSVVSPSQFEAHAGCASRRKPYMHIYTSNGVSLHELSLSLSKDRKFSASDNDDLCTICADGGNLLLCDGCPRAFHTDCVELSSIPSGKWYCRYCQNAFQRDKCVAHNANAFAAGRVLGVDPIEQISKRCIRIVKTPEVDVGGCVLCRCHDFSKSGFGPRTVLLCDQCEKEFHVGCLKDHNMGNLKELPKGKWFCCADCSRIHAALQKLVFRESEKLPSSLSDVIKIKHKEKDSENDSDLDVRWRVLSGKHDSSDSRLLLSKAVTLFHGCFDPIVDSTTGRDLIPSMVYGRNMRNQEFRGMYCALLTVNSSIVSAGLLRIFGKEVAELPLVATSSENQGQGYFQALFSCIERLLGFVDVQNLVLPAADEAESIWTKKFGFKPINQDQLCEYRKDSQIMTFEGTSMLHKLVPKCRTVGKSATGS